MNTNRTNLERTVHMIVKSAMKTRKGEKPKKIHLIPIQFNDALTIDLAKSVVRRALLLAQAVKCANQAAWEAAPHLSMDPTVLPLPVPKKAKPAKKVRKAKKRSR